MDKEQQNEWAEAQKISLSFDLVIATKKHLLFLAAVDRNRHLYEDHVLQRAIFRYNAYWLPLLAKHSENPISEHPLVVPLDCEWIWHCHRLNPIRYKSDCQKLYGRILGCNNVISSVQAASKNATVEIWNKMYPEEPYELDVNGSFSEDVMQNCPRKDKFTSYDLLAAVKRQIPIIFQVSRPHMSDDLFLREAEARYKGFLHLIRANMKRGIQQFCVPTYDVDLMWHTHQLYPIYYCKDLIALVGKVLQHDDTDSDRSKGNKLDTGFSETTKQWEETFGTRYWKAGAMYRGNPPTPVTHVPSSFKIEGKRSDAIENCGNLKKLSTRQAVEVFLEFVEIKNVPEEHRNNLVVSFSKKQPDMLFDIKRSLTILSESGEKQMAYFQCEPKGEFLFELRSESYSDKLKPNSSKVLGTCSLSLQELVSSRSQLSAEKWLSVDPAAGLGVSEPILLHVAVSFTPPTPTPKVLYLHKSPDSLSLLEMGKINHAKIQTHVTDDVGNVAFGLQMRNTIKYVTNGTPEELKEVYCITNSEEKHKVAEFLENNWVIKGIHGPFTLHNNSGKDDHLFELVGDKMVKLFSGRRLDFEPKHCRRPGEDFITAVEFSAEYPYGRAVALFDLKLGTVKAVDEWFVIPGIILGFILSDMSERKGYNGFTAQIGDKVTIASDQVNEGNGAGDVINDGKFSDHHFFFSADMDSSSAGGGGVIDDGKCSDNHFFFFADMDSSSACGGGKCGGGKCGGSICSAELNTSLKEATRGASGRCFGPCTMCFGPDDDKRNDCQFYFAAEVDKSSACGGGGKCGGGKCGGGKCGAELNTSLKEATRGGSARCFGPCTPCFGPGDVIDNDECNDCHYFFAAEVDKSSACGGGGKCGGGKCGGSICSAEQNTSLKEATRGGKCGFGPCSPCSGPGDAIDNDECNDCHYFFAAEVDKSSACGGGGKCGGGKCGGGKCGGLMIMSGGGCSGGGCNGQCGGKCGFPGMSVGGSDMPTAVVSAIMNEPAAA